MEGLPHARLGVHIHLIVQLPMGLSPCSQLTGQLESHYCDGFAVMGIPCMIQLTARAWRTMIIVQQLLPEQDPLFDGGQ